MTSLFAHRYYRNGFRGDVRVQLLGLLAWVAVALAGPASVVAAPIVLAEGWQEVHDLEAGATVEISVRVDRPSQLPANGRIAVEWQAPPGAITAANWRKVLHALDGDLYLVYRAPVAGKYTLKLAPVVDETPVGDSGPRSREKEGGPESDAISEKHALAAGRQGTYNGQGDAARH